MIISGYTENDRDSIDLSIDTLSKRNDLSRFVHIEIWGYDGNIDKHNGIRFLKLFPNLSILRVENTHADFSILKELKHLQTLYISESPINRKDIYGLGKLSKLHLEQTGIFVGGIIRENMNLYSITDLRLSGEKSTDVHGLRSLNNLKKLDLSENEALFDINPLGGLQNIEFLDLRNTSVKDFSPIFPLKKLKKFSIWKKGTNKKFSRRIISKLKHSLPDCEIVVNDSEEELFIAELVKAIAADRC